MSAAPFPICDAHAHVISEDRERYRPDPLSGALKPGDLDDPMTAERLLREMDLKGVGRAVLVQRAHVYGFDSSYVCDMARLYPDRFAAVCAIDGRDPACGDRVRHWVTERGAVGVRMMEPFRGAEFTWFAGEAAEGIWQAATELSVPVCVHFFRWNREAGIPVLLDLLGKYSKTDVVIDHFSNMASESGPPDHGIDGLMRRLADFPRVSTKFTTLPLGQLHEQDIDSAVVVRRVVDVFGAERVMWGSDISQSKGSYSFMVDLGWKASSLLREQEQRWVLARTAQQLYGGLR